MTTTADTPDTSTLLTQAPTDTYLIIGPKNCGKTVFFVAAIDQMQRKGNEGEIITVEYMTRESKNFVADNLDAMRSSQWPTETPPLGNRFDVKFRCEGLLRRSETRLVLSDYPGGAFNAAFGDQDALDPNLQRQYEGPANRLKNDVLDVDGIFLLLECATIYEGRRNSELDDCLFNLVEHLRNNHKKKKTFRLAVVFTKKDTLPDVSFVPEELLKQQYPDAWPKIKSLGVKFFTISSVNETRVDSDGHRVPKEGYNSTMSEGLTAPLFWMLDMPESTIKERISTGSGDLFDWVKKKLASIWGCNDRNDGKVSS